MPHRKIVYLDFDKVLYNTSLVTKDLFSRIHRRV